VNNFDGNPAIQGYVRGQEHHSHPSPPQLALEPVLRPQRSLQHGEEIQSGIAHVGTEVKWTKRILT
jgi:hypothetical protein